MATRAVLDVTRTQMVEKPFSKSVRAKDIDVPAGGKNLVYKWAHTQTWTLQPLNYTTDFAETSAWEAAKFRLSDVTYDPDFWVEVPEHQKGDESWDYFFNCVIPADRVTEDLTKLPLDNIMGIDVPNIVTTLAYQQNHMAGVLASKQEYPANQGYLLRFHMEGRDSFLRGNVMAFNFGDFQLRLHTNGMAELWQTVDMIVYALVYTFPWAEPSQVHGRKHQITIYPHSRNKIEFMAATGPKWNPFGLLRSQVQRGTRGGGLYEVPGELVLNDDNTEFVITQAGHWFLAVSKEFRPYIQISRLIFADGADQSGGLAYLFDTPINYSDYVGPLMPVRIMAEADHNHGDIDYLLLDGDTREPFVPDGVMRSMQFGLYMNGLRDISSVGHGYGSTKTPEFYGYSLAKDALFESDERNPQEFPVQSIQIDFGESPEAESLHISIDNSHPGRGQAADFERRADIPLELYDDETGLLLFEGWAEETDFDADVLANPPRSLKIQARGMADTFLRIYWGLETPDFEKDPDDVQGRGYEMPAVIRTCFESAGTSSDEVVIEEEEMYLRDFRLWTAPAGGGSRGGSSGVGAAGDGHNVSQQARRWMPTLNTPVYEFHDNFIRGILGWNWVRDRSDRKWHIYKRPDPNLDADIAADKFIPKAVFYNSPDLYDSDDTNLMPKYKASGNRLKTVRPICNTIQMLTIRDVCNIRDKAALRRAIEDFNNGGDPSAPIYKTAPQLVPAYFTNYRSYPGTRNPGVNHLNNPDWLGHIRTRYLFVSQATTDEAVEWIGRRLYEDNCFGYVWDSWVGDWGDEYTYNLRKWDVVMRDTGPGNSLELWYIDRIEPEWTHDRVRRARYRGSLYRPDVRPPR